jgi:hypothetical protein
MSPFQLAGVTVTLTMALLIALGLLRRSLRPATALPWLGLWLLAAAAIAKPNATTQLARLVGIGRGADALLYCAVLVGLVVALRHTLAQRRLERQMTLLVRALALQSARLPVVNTSLLDTVPTDAMANKDTPPEQP